MASQHNSNFSVIYSDYNGSISDANISASAAIANTKLAQITVAGTVSGAALTSINSVPTGAGALPAKNGGTGGDMSTAAIGAVPYFSATGVMSALAAGTTGQVKVSQGGAAPIWANALSSVSDYGTSTSTSSAKQATATKICFGTTTGLTNGGTFVITNLPFTSSSSYYVVCSPVSNVTVQSAYAINNSASQCTLTSMPVPAGANVTCAYNWFAVGV